MKLRATESLSVSAGGKFAKIAKLGPMARLQGMGEYEGSFYSLIW